MSNIVATSTGAFSATARHGLAVARSRGRAEGWLRVVDGDERRTLLARHDDRESIHTIAAARAETTT